MSSHSKNIQPLKVCVLAQLAIQDDPVNRTTYKLTDLITNAGKHCSRSQVYIIIQQLTLDKLVEADSAPPRGRQERKAVRLTEAGRHFLNCHGTKCVQELKDTIRMIHNGIEAITN